MQKMIERPSEEQVKKYIKHWNNLDNYIAQEKALNILFSYLPHNKKIEDVLLKVCCLNRFYSTNIFDVYTVSKHIVSLNIDGRLKKKDLSVVKDIANVEMKNGKIKNFYSFATKYCSHHFERDFPIYDSYVDKMLTKINKQEHFSDFNKADLKTYENYYKVLIDFRNHFNLGKFSLKQLDMYLWRAGEELFPKNY